MDDLDIEMGEAAEVLPMQEPEPIDILDAEEQEPGEVEEAYTSNPAAETDNPGDRAPVPNKVHIRGLDTVNADELKQYLGQTAGGTLERVEWIDDTSANIVFGSASAAQDALVALAAVAIADPSQLPPLEALPAKPFAAKPEAAFQVRLAVASDRKQSGAAARSRFYLLHPEWDPEERRRHSSSANRRYRERDGDWGHAGGRDRRGSRRDEHYRHDDDEPEAFDVSLYDDDAEALAKRAPRPERRPRRGGSRSPSPPSDTERRRQQNREKELFPDRRARGRDEGRGRSASPARDRDGDAAMDDLARDREAVARNREKARSLKDRIARADNSAKELFPSKVAGEERKPQMDQVASDRTASTKATTTTTGGISIRGIAGQQQQQQRGGTGFAIKGASSARELFPEKFGGGGGGGGSNAGKELFADRLEGRGRRRQRAEDSFY